MSNNTNKTIEALTKAIMGNDTNKIDALLPTLSKEDINKPNKEGELLVHVAAIHTDKDTLRKLVEKGADINGQDSRGYTPLDRVTLEYEVRKWGILRFAGELLSIPDFIKVRGMKKELESLDGKMTEEIRGGFWSARMPSFVKREGARVVKEVSVKENSADINEVVSANENQKTDVDLKSVLKENGQSVHTDETSRRDVNVHSQIGNEH